MGGHNKTTSAHSRGYTLGNTHSPRNHIKAFVTPSIDDLRSAMILNGAMVLGTHQ